MDDTTAMFDALGMRRRRLVAHDWGAVMIAWAFAIRRTRPLDGLVIMNVPRPAVFQRVLRRSLRQLARSRYVAFFQLPFLPEQALRAHGALAVGQMFRGMAVDKTAFPDDVLAHYQANAVRPGAMTGDAQLLPRQFRRLCAPVRTGAHQDTDVDNLGRGRCDPGRRADRGLRRMSPTSRCGGCPACPPGCSKKRQTD